MANDQISSLKEWAPLTDLFNLLPTRTNKIFSQEIKLTCVDVLPEFLAIGTNAGVVYWFDRKRKILQRLRCEDSNVSLTFVRIVSTVEYMVACGNQNGNITIFQIPKLHPDTLPDNLKPKQKQVERYTVMDLHKSAITAIEWSKNGMKLFSGDKRGCVVLTEIDFYLHMCKSIEVLNESYEVVQLSYSHQRLLISTTFRSIICHQMDKWKVCQIGRKDRKMLGKFGGLIYQYGFKPTDIKLYCTRPGLRIWISDLEGNVKKTLLFKDLLNKECPQVPLLNPISKELQKLKSPQEPYFGKLLSFCDCLLVTHSNDAVYILDPEQMTILATISQLRNILDISTYKDEIFILEEDRSLLRVAFSPESNRTDLLAPTPSTIFNALDTTRNIFSGSVSKKLGDDATLDNTITNAEEAQESPKEIHRCFDDIGKQEFEDNILFKQSKRNKKKMNNQKDRESVLSSSSNSSEERELNIIRPTLMNLSTVGVLPDLRSPESIINDIEYKEKILADVLNLDKVKIKSNEDSYNSISPEYKAKELKNDIFSIPHCNDIVISHVKKKGHTAGGPVKSIPDDWNLSNVEIEKKSHSEILLPKVYERKLSTTDSSLSDWEIV